MNNQKLPYDNSTLLIKNNFNRNTTIIQFANLVAIKSKGLAAMVAKLSIEQNNLNELIEVFTDYYYINSRALLKMLGKDLYNIFLELKEK